MSAPLTQIFSLTLIPVAATILGGVVASDRAPREKLRSFVPHFAGGVVFAVVAGELLPEITREHRPLGVVIGFALGVLVLLAVRQFAQGLERREGREQPDRRRRDRRVHLTAC